MDLDEIINQANHELGATQAPSGASGLDLDSILSQAHQELVNAPVVPENNSEIRGVLNAGIRGAGGFLGFVDEFNPLNVTDNGIDIEMPRLFGLFGSEREPFAQAFERAGERTGILTKDVPTSETGKLLASAAEQAGGSIPFGPTAIVSNAILGGTGAYLGEKGAEKIGVSPQLGKAAGSIGFSFAPQAVEKLITKASELFGPLTNAGRNAAVGTLLRESATNAGGAKAALEAADSVEPSLFSPFITGAEAAKDVGLSRLEDAAKAYIPNESLSAMDVARAGKRAAVIDSMFDPTISKIERSKSLESAIAQSADNVGAVEQAAWEALPKDAPVRIPEQIKDIENAINEYTLGIEDAPSNIRTLFTKIKRLDWQPEINKAGEAYERLPGATMGEVQKLRSLALKVARGSNDPVERSLAGIIAGKLEEGVVNSVDGEAADIWKAARSITAQKNEVLKATSGISKASGLGKGELYDAQLLNEGLGSPDKFTALLKAAGVGGVDISGDAKGALLQSITRKANGMDLPQSQWISEFSKRKDQFSKVFSKEEMGVIESTLDDIAAQGDKYNRTFQATKGQSATAPRQEVIKRIKKAKGVTDFEGLQKSLPILGGFSAYGGFTPSGIATGIAGSLVGKGIQKITENASKQFDDLFQAVLKDPKLLAQALKEPESTLLGQVGRMAVQGSKDAAGAVISSTISNLLRGRREALPDIDMSTLDGFNFEPDTKKNSSIQEESMSAPDETFGSKVDEVAKNLGTDPKHLMQVMHFETGGTLDSATKNRAGSGATGLIQFMPDTAKDLTGADTKEAATRIMAQMTPTEQLDYVEKYLTPFKGKLNNLEDLYMAVLYPKAVGKDSEYALFKKGTTAYWQNKGLDIDGDGVITKREAANKVAGYRG